MDDHNDDGADPEEEEEMSTLKRLVTEVVVEGAKTLIEKIWKWFTGDTKRLS